MNEKEDKLDKLDKLKRISKFYDSKSEDTYRMKAERKIIIESHR